MKNLFIFLLVILSACKFKTFRDTEGWDIKSKYNSDNKVFTTGSKFYYDVTWLSENEEVIKPLLVNHLRDTFDVKKIVLTILPGGFMGQTKIKWEYLNSLDSVVNKSITGVVEDSSKIWIHPPRNRLSIYIH